MKLPLPKFTRSDRRLLPEEGRFAGPMPWVIAIMMFLTVLAAAAGLGLRNAANTLGSDLGNRITIQIVEANPDFREAQARIAIEALRKLTGVRAIHRIEAAELEQLLEPWLGAGGLETDLPMPVMIDVDLTPEAYGRLDVIRAAVRDVAPAARIDDNAQWLTPLARLIDSLGWLATGLVALMIAATAATVVLAARAALDTHRGTIEVLHLMGATDVQVAALFQRRIALDALFGGFVGLALGALVLVVISNRVGALGSDLLGSSGLPVGNWITLICLPVGGVILATLVARLTILRALGRML